MNQGKICVSICGETADEVLSRMDLAREVADVLEIRFDCLRAEDIEPLLKKLATRSEQLLYTFRPAEQGGRRPLTRAERIAFWDLAASYVSDDTLVDLECDVDFPVKIDSELVIGSKHRFDERPGNFAQDFEDLLLFSSGARKFAVTVNDASDAVDVWKLLVESGKPAIPIAMGEAGKWTRILGLAYGAFLAYASFDPTDATAPGQIPAAELRDVFRVKNLDGRTHVYAVLAGDTSYTLSPYMHNAAFAASSLDSVFVPMQVGDLDAFMRRMVSGATREVELHLKGFSVTNPHKQAVIRFLDHIDDAAQKIGAVNTIKVEKGKLHGFNTDVTGFIEPLKGKFGDLRGASATVAGTGGAARACVYALTQEGAEVTVLARDKARAGSFSDEFGVRVESLTDERKLTTDLLVNATPLGTKGENANRSIATATELRNVKLVYDLVYNPTETVLIKEARNAGVETLGGLDMLIAQGAKQFLIWTGHDAPVDVMKAAVEARLS